MLKALLRKEMILSSHILTYFFIAFGLMAFLPGYPVLCGAFFVTLGIYQSYQWAREANDVVYSALLPVAKKDVVKGKFLFVMLIEGCSFLIMAIATLIRMTVLAESEVYLQNFMMNANLFFLGVALLIFGLFNLIFIAGFFKTAYKFGRPFLIHIFVCFLIIAIAETLHHLPGLDVLNAFGFNQLGLQLSLLAFGVICFFALTLLAFRKACSAFEKIDL